MSPIVISETSDYIIINKPAGLMVHGDGKSIEKTLADWVLETYPYLKDIGEPWTNPEGEVIYRPGIVHRLDRETSGLMVLAKNQEMFELLKKQFQDRLVEKRYHAFVYGELKTVKGVIDRPIGRSASDFRKYSAQRGAKGQMRDAVTKYRVLRKGPDITFVEAEPKTGRTHQIRVHMKAIGHPVVCDKVYAPNHECMLGFGRTALHAKQLSFFDKEGVQVTFEAPYPADFKKAVAEFESLC